MFVKFLPSDIARIWNYLDPAIRATFTPEAPPTEYRIRNIEQALLTGDVTAWMMIDEGDGNGQRPKPEGVALTTIVWDLPTMTKNLLLYALASVGESPIPRKMMEQGLDGLKKYARGEGCYKILFYTDEQGLAEMAVRMYGADSHRHVITIPTEA